MKPSMADRLAALSSAQRTQLLRKLVEADRLAEIPDAVPPREPGTPVRLSPAQEDLWIYEELYPDTGALNLCCSYNFDHQVSPADLEAALTLLQANHDILRMRIVGGAGDLRVEFPPAAPFALDRVDLRDSGASLDDVLEAFARRTFALNSGALIRGTFITVDDTRTTLVLKLHHIVTDWWSFDILHTEFSAAYLAISQGRTPELARPAIQYADFASWQRELEVAGVLDAQLEFWRGYLDGLPPPLTVASPAGRAAAGSGLGIDRVPFEVSAATEATVRTFAKEHHATVYGVLIAAFAVLAHRLSSQPDLIIGTPVANRSARGLDRVIGYVMNAVPTRWQIGPADSFADVLARFSAGFPRALANADVPVGRMVTALDPARTPGQSPLFQWVFMYLPGQASEQALREFANPRRVHTGGEHDVVGVVQDTGDRMAGTIEFRTDVYPPEVVARWADSFSVLLPELLADPQAPVAELRLLSDAEQDRLLHQVNGAPVSLPPVSLAGLVQRQAARTPDAIALESGALESGALEPGALPSGAQEPGALPSGAHEPGGVSLSYAELTARVDALARTLAARGAAPGTIVALALRRSVAMVIALLAVQRAGAAYLPIDSDYPAERIGLMLDDAAPNLLIADTETMTGLPESCLADALLLDPVTCELRPARPGGAVAASASGDVVLPAASPGGIGYVMFTSGSTGRPKGVVVSHAGIASLADGLGRVMRLTAGSRVLQLSSPSFDISVGEMCMAFGSGGTLVVPPAGPLAGDELADIFTRCKITATLLPPTVLASVPLAEYPELRALALGAEACPAELVAAWSAGGRLVFNAYGPTESTCAATISDPLPAGSAAPPIGRGVTNTRAYVLDDRLRPVPVGVPGELYLAGRGLAHGYLGRPAATAERFSADPHAAEPGARMYRTGDLVRRRADGQLDFLGRADDQISLRGFRIEPGEVESVLAGDESVAQVAVLLREDAPGQQRLVAYLVPRPGAQLSQEKLLARAVAALPAHMVPGAFVQLDVLPFTTNGKLDKAALPTPVREPKAASRPPATPAEESLCALFAEVLDLPQVGAGDDFFDLGGDSIMAIQLVSRARAAGLGFSPREVFTTRTPGGLAALAHAPADPATTAADCPDGRLPLTPVMHWYRERGGPLDSFTMSMLFPAPAGLTVDRIAAALATLAERHPVLRMRLLNDEQGDWELEVRPATGSLTGPDAAAAAATGPAATGPGVTVLDAAGLTDAELRAAAQERAAHTRLDPRAGQLLSATWWDRGQEPGPGAVLLTVHHFAADGVSWRLLQPEFADLLAAEAGPDTGAPDIGAPDIGAPGTGGHDTGRRAWMPAGTSFRRWSQVLTQQAVADERVRTELPHWERVLAGRADALAPGRPASAARGQLTATLPADQTAALLTTVAAAFRCGPNDILLTALLAAAIRWRGTGTGLLVNLEGHGREAPSEDIDLSRTVGWFTTQYPVRLDAGPAAAGDFWAGGSQSGQALKQVKEQLRAVPGGGLGYGLLRYLNPQTTPRLASRAEPDVRFNYLGRFTDGGAGGGELLGTAEDGLPLAHAVELDAVTQVGPDGPRLVASWSYATQIVSDAAARELAELWFEALAVLARHASQDGAGGSTSSDFPLVELTQEQIEAMESDLDGLAWSEQS